MDIIEGESNQYRVVAKSVSGRVKPLPGPVGVILDNENAAVFVTDDVIMFDARSDGPVNILVSSGALSLTVAATVATLPAAVLELVPV